jgi:hypothetical protein
MVPILAARAVLAAEVPGLDILGGSVIGIILLLSLFGYIWFKPSIDRLIADKEKAETQRDALVAVYETQVIPVLSDVQHKVLPALTELRASQAEATAVSARLAAALERVERELEILTRRT